VAQPSVEAKPNQENLIRLKPDTVHVIFFSAYRQEGGGRFVFTTLVSGTTINDGGM